MPPPQEIEVDLTKTGGRLIPPDLIPKAPAGRPPLPKAPPPPGSAPPREPGAHAHEPPKEGERPKACKLCGWDPGLNPLEPEPGDAYAFREAVFAGAPYEKQVPVFDGALVVTFRDLTADENDAVRVRVEAELKGAPVPGYDVVARYTELAMGLAVARVVAGARAYAAPDTPDPFAADLDARHRALRTWLGADTVYRTVRWEYGRFTAVLATMLGRATDRSFFKATGPRGGTPESRPQP